MNILITLFFILKQIYNTQKYVISVEEDGLLHKLDIINPVMADIGKYSCEINGVSTQAYLDVEGKDFLEFYESY